MFDFQNTNLLSMLLCSIVIISAIVLLIIILCKFNSCISSALSKKNEVLEFSIAKEANKSAQLEPYLFTDEIPATLRRMGTKQ